MYIKDEKDQSRIMWEVVSFVLLDLSSCAFFFLLLLGRISKSFQIEICHSNEKHLLLFVLLEEIKSKLNKLQFI